MSYLIIPLPVCRGRPLKQAIQECEAKWFIETLAAANDGEANQMALLGHMYSVGYGCQPDPVESQRWFDEANKRLGYNVLAEHQAQHPQRDPHHDQQQEQQHEPMQLDPSVNQASHPPAATAAAAAGAGAGGSSSQYQEQSPHLHHHRQQQQQDRQAPFEPLPEHMLVQDDNPDALDVDQQKAGRLPRLAPTRSAAVLGSSCPPVTSQLYREAELHTLKQGQQQQA